MEKRLLQDRELQILVLMSKNHTNQQIADSIHISVHTVKAHNTNIFRKLNAKNRTEAVVIAIKNGYIPV